MKVVINKCYGGFGLSEKAKDWLILNGVSKERAEELSYCSGEDRADPLLIRCVEELGEEAYGNYASLKVVEIPDGISWHISDYDGHEHIAQDHQTWD